jgi:hypothetical protein
LPNVEIKPDESVRLKRYRQAAALLQKWSREDPDYDERAGSILESELEPGAMRCEEKDEPSA